MRDLFIVGVGGFLGSVARYYGTGVALHLSGAARFPWGTLAVNVIGCALIGAIAGAAEQRDVLSASTRLFLLTGLLGGFTTFSAFAYESLFLVRSHAVGAALLNVTVHVVLGMGAVWLGHQAVGVFAR